MRRSFDGGNEPISHIFFSDSPPIQGHVAPVIDASMLGAIKF